MGGSYGWASAGIFHEARMQTRRFLAAFGGFIDQDSNYSFGTALKFLPHVLGSAQAVTGPLTSWSSIARHSRLVVLVRRRQPQEHAGRQGRLRRAQRGRLDGGAGACRRRGHQCEPVRDDGPQAAGASWIPIRPNTDTAMLLALTHTLITEGLHDEEFLARYYDGLRAPAALSDGRSRWSAEGRRLGRRDHRGRCRDHPGAGATHGGEPHHDQRIVVAAARRPRRAGLLGGHPPGGRTGSDRLAGRRLRFRLWLGDRHRRCAARVRAARDGGPVQPARPRDPGRAHRRLPAPSWRALRLQRQERHLSGYSTGLLGGRQSVPSSPGHQPAAPRLAAT